MANLSAASTFQPDAPIKYASRKRISKDDWNALSLDLSATLDAGLAGRGTLDQNLDEWNQLYEMQSSQTKDYPYEGAPNLSPLLIPSILESMEAYVASQVLVPNPFIVIPNTPQAVESAHIVERYLNAEYKKQRDDTTMFEQFNRWLHLALRDGNAYLEVLWKYKKTVAKVTSTQPKMEMDEEAGVQVPVLDDAGEPVYETEHMDVENVHNDVEVKAVSLKDCWLVPSTAKTVNEAMAVVRPLVMYEDQLMELVNDDVLDADEVEKALSHVPNGSTEIPSSLQPTGTYTAGDQLDIGVGQGSLTSKFFRNRGPILVYRIHSRQFDLDNDGTPEENVFWFYGTTRRMLGWMRYQYFSGLRPIFDFAPLPRPDEHLGFSLVERLAPNSNELRAQRNGRLILLDKAVNAPTVIKAGSKLADDNFTWTPNTVWETEEPQSDIQTLPVAQVPETAYIEDKQLNDEAKEYAGMGNPAMGTGNSSRRSATEIRQAQASTMTRSGLIAMRFRMAIRPVANFILDLKRQYLQADQNAVDGNGQFQVPIAALNQDQTVNLAGASDPIDAQARRTETLAAIENLVKTFPMLFQNPMRQYYAAKKILSAMNWDVDADQLIGTEDDMKQLAMQMQQQAMMQAQQGQPQR